MAKKEKPEVAGVTPDTSKIEGFDKYEIENAASDIMRAGEHMADPAKMKVVKKHMSKKKMGMEKMMGMLPDEDGDGTPDSLEALKKKRNSKFIKE